MNKFTCFFTLLTVSSVFAQDVPSPPKPADNGPSLEVTIKFIQEQFSSIGPVNYVNYIDDEKGENLNSSKYTWEATNVRASAAACRIDYHWRGTSNGKVFYDQDGWILLKDVTEIVVKTMAQVNEEQLAKAGSPEFNSRVTPPVFAVEIYRGAVVNAVDLYGESLANRIAKALVHAVELCGGGNKDPF